MGSLYDIGNFRYKHFTFYSCGADACSPPDRAPEGSDDDAKLAASVALADHDEQIINFLNRVWPLTALYGQSAEGDYAYVTYVRQGQNLETTVENIYIYVRMRINQQSEATWKPALDPIKTLNPEGDTE